MALVGAPLDEPPESDFNENDLDEPEPYIDDEDESIYDYEKA